jgi:predicted RNA binding protein YcfA (HicA-like mRNA interferase family)
MSAADLDTLCEELPELFQPRDLSPEWNDGLIIVPIHDPERIDAYDSVVQDQQSLGMDDWELTDIEELGVEFIKPGAEPPSMSPIIIDTLGGAHGGAPQSHGGGPTMPPPDCLAFYLPFHYYYPAWWGVYLLFDGVVWLAGEIIRRSNGAVSPRGAMQAARLFLYYHEAFHHKTECFATRLELTHRRPLYKTGFERLYQQTVGKPACLEEALANASALNDGHKRIRDSIVDQALIGYVQASPPGYNRGDQIRGVFRKERCEFAEANQRICLPHLPPKRPDVWHTMPHMFNGIANIKSQVNYVIPRSSPLAMRLPLRGLPSPAQLAKKLGVLAGIQFVRHDGNHDIYQTPTGKTIPIPRHPRDLGRGLLRKILSEAGLGMGIEEFCGRNVIGGDSTVR